MDMDNNMQLAVYNSPGKKASIHSPSPEHSPQRSNASPARNTSKMSKADKLLEEDFTNTQDYYNPDPTNREEVIGHLDSGLHKYHGS